jgi:hypothetical protein
MDYHDVLEAIRLSGDMITLGGGEPTMHPRFFDILQRALWTADYVWLATNGSQTSTMYRLDRIMLGEDSPMYNDDYECTCEEDDPEYFESDGCVCYEKFYDNDIITMERDNQLAVALSQDPWHDPIDPNVVDLWMRRKYEIRNVSQKTGGAIAVGRAKKTGVGWDEDICVCPGRMIRATGKIHACGCKKSPVIGHVRTGITQEWEDALNDSGGYANEECIKGMDYNERPDCKAYRRIHERHNTYQRSRRSSEDVRQLPASP